MIKDLFDFKFENLITRKILGTVYAILVVLISIAAIAMFFVGLSQAERGLVGLVILAPLFWFLSLVFLRVGFETSIALILIAENTKK